MTLIVWNISISQLGSLSGHAPSQLLHPSSLVEYKKLEKFLDLISTTENIRVINILLLLNLKYSSDWEEN